MSRYDPGHDTKGALYKPGTYGCHEALHMSQYLACAIDEELVSHPAIASNPEWQKIAINAADLLVDLYQKIGGAHLHEVPAHQPLDDDSLPGGPDIAL